MVYWVMFFWCMGLCLMGNFLISLREICGRYYIICGAGIPLSACHCLNEKPTKSSKSNFIITRIFLWNDMVGNTFADVYRDWWPRHHALKPGNLRREIGSLRPQDSWRFFWCTLMVLINRRLTVIPLFTRLKSSLGNWLSMSCSVLLKSIFLPLQKWI